MKPVVLGMVFMAVGSAGLAASDALAQGSSSEEKAKASFAQIVKRCTDAFSTKRPERITELPSGGWVRVGGGDYRLSYDITRTQSLVSPLLGVVTAEVTGLSSKRMGSKEEAESAPTEPSLVMKQAFSFALQDGAWVYKSSVSESYPIRDGIAGRKDVVSITSFSPGPGPTPLPGYICAYGAR